MSPSEYQYELLNDADPEIRLLTVFPGPDGQPLVCELKTHNTNSLPQYEAVSYTWGDGNIRNTMQIDSKTLTIHGNAFEALRHLRDDMNSRTLWIDAVCIDQGNLKEKQGQLPLMKYIYAKARRVIVWFSSSTSLKVPLDLLEELRECDDPALQQSILKSAFQDQDLQPEKWLALREFLDHPWWSRVWTLQEVVLAGDIVFCFSTNKFSWSDIAILGREDKRLLRGGWFHRPDEPPLVDGTLEGHNEPLGRITITIIQLLRRMRQEKESRISFPDLLLLCWDRKATDNRDYIYGVAALCDDLGTDVMNIGFNYESPVEWGLTHAVHQILMGYGTLGLFSKAGIGFPRTLESLPSYVPDFNATIAAKPLHYLFDKGRHILFGADKGVGWVDNGTEGASNGLYISGQLCSFYPLGIQFYFIDTVVQVSSEPLGTCKDVPGMEKRLAWFDEAERITVCGPDGGSGRGAADPYTVSNPAIGSVPLFDAFWRTLVANRSVELSTPPLTGSLGYLGYKSILSGMVHGTNASVLFPNISAVGIDPTGHAKSAVKGWVDTLLITSYGRSFCLTKFGRIGLVPPGTRPDDRVCLLVGGAVPFIMRRKKPTTDKPEWQLVGESYIYGVDAIEVMEALRSHNQTPTTVLLV